MGRSSILIDFSEVTLAKHGRIASRTAAICLSDLGPDVGLTRDDIYNHMKIAYDDLGFNYHESHERSYFERMHGASLLTGPETPTLDLITENGCEYRWLRDGSIPAGYLNHCMNVIGGFPRLAFNQFMLIGKHHGIDELVEKIGPENSMRLILQAECYIRITLGNEKTDKELEPYLDQMAVFKAELQPRISRHQVDSFNLLGSQLQLEPPSKN